MTTIVYRDGVLASDSGFFNVERNLYEGATKKVFQLTGGLLYSGAGDVDDRAVRALLDNVRSPDQLPAAKELRDTGCEINALIVFPDGQVFMVNCERRKKEVDDEEEKPEWAAEIVPIQSNYFALGSGRQIAIGALWAGKSATQAVEAAMEHNVWTRGPVQSLKLRMIPETKR